jgi:hypothetical protein
MGQMRMRLLPTLLLAALGLLAACGGGGPDAELGGQAGSTAAAQGLWVGTTSGGLAVTSLVLDDGAFFIVYGRQSRADAVNMVHGTARMVGDLLTGKDAFDIDFDRHSIHEAALEAALVEKAALAGHTQSDGAGGRQTFEARYEAPTQAADLLTVAGSYTGTSILRDAKEEKVAGLAVGVGVTAGADLDATMHVHSTGAFEASAGGCRAQGSLSPDAPEHGYRVQVTFADSTSCYFPNQMLTGVARLDSSARMLVAAVRTGSRRGAVVFVGNR